MRRAALGPTIFLTALQMTVRLTLLATVLLAPVALAQQTQPCGDITAAGRCQQDEAVYCTDPEGGANAPLARVPCDELIVDELGPPVEGRCAELEGYGAWCVLPEGAPCAGYDDDDLYAFACGDDEARLTADAACDLADGCLADIGACDPEGPGPATCLGDRLTLACTAWGQYVTLDCTDPIVGGTCDEGACVVGEGQRCFPDGPLVCAPGLGCAGATEDRAGTCVSGPMPDAGPPVEEDAGLPEEPSFQPPGAITCKGTETNDRSAPLALAWLALVPLLLASRRRG